MEIVATTSLPAVDRQNADRWNAARSCQKEVVLSFWFMAQELRYGHLILWTFGYGEGCLRQRKCTYNKQKWSYSFALYPRSQYIGILSLVEEALEGENTHISAPDSQITLRSLHFFQL